METEPSSSYICSGMHDYGALCRRKVLNGAVARAPSDDPNCVLRNSYEGS